METVKTILWVEDFDDKDTTTPVDDLDAAPEIQITTAHNDEISRVFPKEHCARVDLRETVDSAINAIDTNWEAYDSVVLDVNLTSGWPDADDVQKTIEEKLSKAGVCFPDNIESFKINTGYYLYLYLLCKGFPKDRVIMRTAYKGSGIDGLTAAWDGVFKKAGLQPPVNVGKNDGAAVFHEELNKLYKGDNHYFLIRRIVFDATNHWIEELNQPACDTNSFVYNNAVQERGKLLDKEALVTLLNEVKCIFPARVDDKDTGRIFYKALQKLSMPFEARINYKEIDGNGNAYTYLTVMRIMRNWYAHNIFASADPDWREFLILFTVALRALFDCAAVIIQPCGYENSALAEILGEKEPTTAVSEDEAKMIIYGFFKNTYNASGTSKKTLSSNLENMVEALGYSKNKVKKCTYSKLIEIIWASKYPVRFSFLNDPLLNESGSITVKCNFSSSLLRDDILSKIICADYNCRFVHETDPVAIV